MAGTSLLALIDDIATVLDDIAVMTKVAAKNTAGVLGDDLALNAEQVDSCPGGSDDQRSSTCTDYSTSDAGRGLPLL